MIKKTTLPKGWNDKRIKNVLSHYEAQTEDDAVAEDEAAFKEISRTTIKVPARLLPVVREIIARDEAARHGKAHARRKTK